MKKLTREKGVGVVEPPMDDDAKPLPIADGWPCGVPRTFNNDAIALPAGGVDATGAAAGGGARLAAIRHCDASCEISLDSDDDTEFDTLCKLASIFETISVGS